MKVKNKKLTHEKLSNEKNENMQTEQQYININEKPDYKKTEINNVEHPVDIQ